MSTIAIRNYDGIGRNSHVAIETPDGQVEISDHVRSVTWQAGVDGPSTTTVELIGTVLAVKAKSSQATLDAFAEHLRAYGYTVEDPNGD